jgi:hypothetical protein
MRKEISCSPGRGLAPHARRALSEFYQSAVFSRATGRRRWNTCSMAGLELLDSVAPGVQLHAPPAQRQRGEALQLALNADVACCALLPQLAARQQQLQPCHHPCHRGLSRHTYTHDRCSGRAARKLHTRPRHSCKLRQEVEIRACSCTSAQERLMQECGLARSGMHQVLTGQDLEFCCALSSLLACTGRLPQSAHKWGERLPARRWHKARSCMRMGFSGQSASSWVRRSCIA